MRAERRELELTGVGVARRAGWSSAFFVAMAVVCLAARRRARRRLARESPARLVQGQSSGSPRGTGSWTRPVEVPTIQLARRQRRRRRRADRPDRRRIEDLGLDATWTVTAGARRQRVPQVLRDARSPAAERDVRGGWKRPQPSAHPAADLYSDGQGEWSRAVDEGHRPCIGTAPAGTEQDRRGTWTTVSTSTTSPGRAGAANYS